MNGFRIDTGVLGHIAETLRAGGNALGSGPAMSTPDAGELTAVIAAALSTVHTSTTVIGEALSAMADGVTKTASMAEATDRESAALFEGLMWD